jgi:nicotinamidase-related amidase
MTDKLVLDPARTAIVLIEYQNEFTCDGGVLKRAPARPANSLTTALTCLVRRAVRR